MTIVAGTETKVNTYIAGNQTWQQVTALADGGWVVTWSSEGQEGGYYPYYGIYQQAYNANGTARGTEVQVNANAHGLSQAFAEIAASRWGLGGNVATRT